MIITTEPQDHPIVDLQEVFERYRLAVKAMYERELLPLWTTTPAGRLIAEAVDLVPKLSAELTEVRFHLARTVANLQYLIAAARATLGAHADGEADPLYYLRDELQAQGQLPRRYRERP